ncbi:MAG: histone deacetylase family protein [Verrucomicrobia bacterium]|nr:histone deacetylase family protein [Verrucomicrobiota bacterium]
MTIVLDPRCTAYHQPGHPEKPNRVARTADLLKSQKSLPIRWAEPVEVADALLLLGHSPAHLARMKVEAPFDADTPWHPDIEGHARRSVGAAVRAMELAVSGEPAFALMRPPGHHAERHRAMGFCYYSSMALAALEAKSRGLGPVAVFDFDVHHGNGTEDCLKGVDGVAFASVHQGDAYPGTGQADVGPNCFNHPVPGGSPRTTWRWALEKAWQRLLATRPRLIGISAGFDAYSKDPLANGTLEREDFQMLGQWARASGVPTFAVLEGGYSLDLPDLVLHFLLGWEGG